ncbi:MAG: imidazole glycerol phosphate synthase subunit HisH [Chthoniobacterales bacterium]
MRLNIGIVDYGLGNVRSVQNALERLDCRVFLSRNEETLAKADALILPGVGAFHAAMHEITTTGLDAILRRLAIDQRKPLLGICLGMQVLAEWGEEHGRLRGLGFIPGEVKALVPGAGRKIPHVGWSGVALRAAGKNLFSRKAEDDSYYFDHSYVFDAPEKYRAATVAWDDELVVAVAKENVMGVQFHPEKSQNAGLRILKAFTQFTKTC